MLQPQMTDLSVKTPVLSVDDLVISYRRGKAWQEAVANVSFEIASGEAVGLVGESGSGKTSIALAALQYLPKTARMSAKRLQFNGTDLIGLSADELRQLRGNRISAVYQHPGSALNPTLSIGLQLTELLRRHRRLTRAEAREQTIDLLARVRLRQPKQILDFYPHELSGGMQQRVTIAMAIALQPALIVLDEPTTALDASVQADIIALLNELRAEFHTSLLMISHDIDLMRHAVDRVGVMKGGELVEMGAVASIYAQPRHPYTRQLLANGADGRIEKTRPATGAPGDLPIPRVAGSGLRKSFGAVEVLHGVDLTLTPGETLGLIGESGSGKSTLARIVTGLEPASDGSIKIDGNAVAKRVERRSDAARRSMQMVFQSPDTTLNPRHRVGRILAGPFWERYRSRRPSGIDIKSLMRAVQLPADVEARFPHELSGGQRQRVAIARAFARNPGIVVLDEPTSALDPTVQAAVLALLRDLQQQYATAYLFISHDLKVIRAMADRIAVLYRGHVVETGTTTAIFQGPNHPYTRMLLQATLAAAAAPAMDAVPIGGIDEPVDDNLSGCAFMARCPAATDRCRQAPPVQQVSQHHQITCWIEPVTLAAISAGAASVRRNADPAS